MVSDADLLLASTKNYYIRRYTHVIVYRGTVIGNIDYDGHSSIHKVRRDIIDELKLDCNETEVTLLPLAYEDYVLEAKDRNIHSEKEYAKLFNEVSNER